MYKYTQKEFDELSEGFGRKVCQGGDYSEIKEFPDGCMFFGPCIFGPGSVFGSNTRFAANTFIALPVSIGAGSTFGKNFRLGENWEVDYCAAKPRKHTKETQ